METITLAVLWEGSSSVHVLSQMRDFISVILNYDNKEIPYEIPWHKFLSLHAHKFQTLTFSPTFNAEKVTWLSYENTEET